MSLQRVCVFCGSGNGAQPQYRAVAADFGRHLAQEKVGVVWTVPALADSREVGNRLSVKEDGDGIVAAEVHR